MIEIQIPAKVMLTGEYSVMHGGSAVLMPVSRYLHLRETDETDRSEYFQMIKQALDYPISEIKTFEKKNSLPDIHLDSDEFFAVDSRNRTVKLGLGLSAAEAVGVVALRFMRAGLKSTDNSKMIFEYAHKIHSLVQGGRGSGADIAACAYSKPIHFKWQDDKVQIKVVRKSGLLEKIPLHLYWTGVSANTRQYIERYNDWIKSDKSSIAVLDQLTECSHIIADLWTGSDLKELFRCCDDYLKIMRKIAIKADMRFELEIHRRLYKWARKHGGYAKPTGAGGGDMILLIGDLPVTELDSMVIPLTSKLPY